ncbi:hypothetical protein [Tepidiforma sp.]|uniref:hypothetical protein n=1 Tax=Tepidiforma sp. TaxID=2682230 RepID=UPI002ADD68FC|nr:hypothetical protein [Tepidiforma sp.]
MMFPKDRTIYSNLNTAFTAFDALLEDCRNRKLTGYVEVAFPGYTGTLILSEGEILNGVVTAGADHITGPAAIRNIAERAAQRDGTITVATAFPDVVLLVDRLMESRPLYKDLTSAFTSLDRLIAKLRTDAITGYVEVQVSGEAGTGVIYLQDGEPIESVFTAPRLPMMSGQDALNAIVAAVNTAGGTFNVFIEASAPSAIGLPRQAPQAESYRHDLLAFWAEVIQRVEQYVDGVSRPGRFALAFKETLVNRAATYPFLDPFAAEFAYTNGTIEFHGPLPDDFSKALGDCLGDTVSRLAFQLKRADLETRVRAALEGIGQRHAAVIERFNLREECQEFVA